MLASLRASFDIFFSLFTLRKRLPGSESLVAVFRFQSVYSQLLCSPHNSNAMKIKSDAPDLEARGQDLV